MPTYGRQGTPGLSGQGATGDRFGESWTAGDFNEDGYDDLAIGIPGDNLPGANDAGRVQVLFGSDDGLSATGQQLLQDPALTCQKLAIASASRWRPATSTTT